MHFNGPQTKFIRDSLYKHPVDPTSKYKSIHIQVFKYPCIQVFKYESIECMQAFKFAILEFGQLLTYNVKARDPVGSKNGLMT